MSARAGDQGQGASAFRAFLRALPDEVARAGGLEVRFPHELPEHARRLMGTLGVAVVEHELANLAPAAERSQTSRDLEALWRGA